MSERADGTGGDVIFAAGLVRSEGAARRGRVPGPRVLAIVPALNESASIAGVVSALRRESGFDVVVVDDGSTDDTGVRAASAGALVVRFPANLGIGAALRAGFMTAMRLNYDAAFQFDADGQHDVRSVPAILGPILAGEYDLVIGSRFRDKDHSYRVPASRRLAMRLVAGVIRRLTGLDVTDASSGFRTFSARAIGLFSTSYPIDYMDSVEALVIAAHADLRVKEVAVTMRERQHGASSASWLSAAWHTLRAVFSVAVAHWQPLRRGKEASPPMEDD